MSVASSTDSDSNEATAGVADLAQMGVDTPAGIDKWWDAYRSEVNEAALAYIRAGIVMMPLLPDAKRPPLPHWPGEVVDEATVAEWFREDRFRRVKLARIGVETGPSRLVIFDRDGAVGERSWENVIADYKPEGEQYDPLTVLSGSTGRHAWHRVPDGVEIDSSIGLLGEGIDVRADGGMVVAPPSLHWGGDHDEGGRYEDGQYLFDGLPEDYADVADLITEVPVWLLKALADAKGRTPRAKGLPSSAGEMAPDLVTLVAELTEDILNTPGQGRHGRLMDATIRVWESYGFPDNQGLSGALEAISAAHASRCAADRRTSQDPVKEAADAFV